MSRSSQREPRFVWTGVLILVPVLALGAVGMWQLRQDRAAALAGAQELAGNQVRETLGAAEELVDDLSRDSAREGFSAALEPDGTLKQTLYAEPPVPVAEPSASARGLAALADDQKLPPAEKAAAALKLSQAGGVTASGLPVKPIALRLALQFGAEAGQDAQSLELLAEDLCEEAAIKQPSMLSKSLIQQAVTYLPADRRSHWIETWERNERLRRFYQRHEPEIRRLAGSDSNSLAWLAGANGQPALLTLVNGSELAAIPADAVRPSILDRLPSLPDHLGLRLWIADRIAVELRAEEGQKVLAFGGQPALGVRAEIFLANEAILLGPVITQTRRTALIISLAALAAAVGWFAAWRAFVRQQQLAAMKDNFVSAVSHELKAPIASIGLMAEELGAGSAKREEYTKLIAGECARLGSLVENVLDYARIESGSDEFVFEEADLGELVRAAADLMRPPAAEREIEIEVEAPPPGELCAEVDARAIARAIVNLLDNAIKYAPAGSPITLTAKGNLLSVSDRGKPIPAGERNRIFERFFRSGSEPTRETKGVGIGLSLVGHIAEAHGGRAWVESKEGGNHFIVEISS